MTRRDLPNLISALRMVLVIPITVLLLRERYTEALYLFAAAGLSDALDGWLAKHYGWTSWLGGHLDPMADKLLLVASYLALGWLSLLPLWLVAAVLTRDVVIVAGAFAYHFWIARLEADPTLLSKLNTLAQILLVLVVVFKQAMHVALGPLIATLIYVVTFTTMLTGVLYVWSWGRRAWRVAHARRPAP